MTPAARAQAAIMILDRILAGDPAEAALLRWARASRFAGSGDRSAVRDLVFDNLRRRDSRAALGGALTGRGLILGMCREEGVDPSGVFLGEGHAAPRLSEAELASGQAPVGAVRLDLPDWMLPDWNEALGRDADAVALAMRDRAPVWLRVNRLRATPQQAAQALSDEGIRTEPSADLPSALRISEGARRLSGSQAYRDGLVELQDLSPQLACAMLPNASRILDYCAGGGGKSLAMASEPGAEVTAHDANPARMGDLAQRAKRAGARISIVQPGQIRGGFDLVVTDVPCSGSGTWRRTPDAKWRLDRAGLEALVALQRGIMDEAAKFVAPGGYLAYMTCSLFADENDRQVGGFVERTGFSLISRRLFTPLDASDGFYAAILKAR